MPHDDLVRVKHILRAADNVARWSAGSDWTAFETNELLQAAVAYEIQVVGEAASRLDESFKASLPQAPWSKIVRMRHRLVHDYYRTDPRILWDVATVHLPQLASYLRARASHEDE
jgi:uncharacterized protein with HEPN domain